jgi:hypothetical protein
MQVNNNHLPSVQFASIAHELGHLFLGHLGPDKALNVQLEAESVSYLVCARNGVTSKSETYLKNYVTPETMFDHIDIYQIMWAAGQVETLLGLNAHTGYEKPGKRPAV